MTETVPSSDYLRLAHLPARSLQAVFRRGKAPDVAGLVGWEYRGANLRGAILLARMRRFIKGFQRVDEGAVEGYNVAVSGWSLAEPWRERRWADGSREFARFRVLPVGGERSASRGGRPDSRQLGLPGAGQPAGRVSAPPHPWALLLDYGVLPHPELGPAAALANRLRDYVVRVRRGSDDVLLGRAYLEFGSRSLPVGWFALERLQRPPHG
jgi:hypothetical protein